MTPLLGAAAGFTLLWWLLLSIWTKPIIQAEISRYIVVTKKTFLEAFADKYQDVVKQQADWLGFSTEANNLLTYTPEPQQDKQKLEE